MPYYACFLFETEAETKRKNKDKKPPEKSKYMNETQRLLLKHIAASLFQAPAPSILTEEVIVEAEQQAVLGLLPLRSDKRMLQLLARNIQVKHMHIWLHGVMDSAEISYCILKGVTSAAYYPQPNFRAMGDVDFIVRREDLERAGQALEQAGCRREEFLHPYHHAYHKDGFTFELHWDAPGVPADNPVIRRLLDDLIDKAELKDGCMQADAFHHGLVLLLHTAVHMLNYGVGLRQLCDWAVFAASFDDQEFRDLFEEKLKSAGLLRFAQLLSLTSAKYMAAPKLPWMGEAKEEILEGIMEDLLDAGNFGEKDKERLNQGKMITDRGSRAVGERGALSQISKTIMEQAFFEWPLCKKHKILLPAGWVYISVRHIVRILHGERPKMHIIRMISGAQKRRMIYREFHLFSDSE